MMQRIKPIIRALLSLYDNALYAVWRCIEERPPKTKVANRQPLVSLIMPTYNTDLDFLRMTINSVINQRYKNWELVIVDDASTDESVRTEIAKYAAQNEKIVFTFLERNHHIAEATNAGVRLAKGEYIGLLDHDDLIYPDTLAEVVLALQKWPNAKFIYTDEDKIVGNKRIQPFFKPDWNLGLLHCVNYITHFAVIKKGVLDDVGFEDGNYNGAQDWELFLRLGRRLSSDEIVHIPRILYSWRVHASSTASDFGAKPYVIEAQQKAVEADLKIRHIQNKLYRNKKYPGQLVVEGRERPYGIVAKDLITLVGYKRALYVLISSPLALSRHIYRTCSYDKIDNK